MKQHQNIVYIFPNYVRLTSSEFCSTRHLHLVSAVISFRVDWVIICGYHWKHQNLENDISIKNNNKILQLKWTYKHLLEHQFDDFDMNTIIKNEFDILLWNIVQWSFLFITSVRKIAIHKNKFERLQGNRLAKVIGDLILMRYKLNSRSTWVFHLNSEFLQLAYFVRFEFRKFFDFCFQYYSVSKFGFECKNVIRTDQFKNFINRIEC